LACGQGRQILGEGSFGADGFADSVGADGTFVLTSTQLMQAGTEFAKAFGQLAGIDLLQIAAGMDVHSAHFFCRDRAHTKNFGHRQFDHKRINVLWRHGELAVGFFPV
jgi:hypothetical protein